MGSDGASNMTGVHNGLSTRLRQVFPEMMQIHCLNHRLELAFRDVMKTNKQYEKLMTLLTGLHYFYQYHKQKQGLLETFKAVDIKGVLPAKVIGTR